MMKKIGINNVAPSGLMPMVVRSRKLRFAALTVMHNFTPAALLNLPHKYQQSPEVGDIMRNRKQAKNERGLRTYTTKQQSPEVGDIMRNRKCSEA